jgi:hypothetical protein
MSARKIHQSDIVQTKLAKLRKALTETTICLIKNGKIPSLGNTPEDFDLTELKPQLLALSKKLKFDCLELAEILHTRQRPPLLGRYKPAKGAAEALLARAKRLVLCADGTTRARVMRDGYAISEIRSAVQTGNVDFFVKFGNYLTESRRKTPRKKEPVLEQDFILRALLDMFWKPAGKWPGLAYCKNSARIEYLLTYLETKGFVTHSLTRRVGPKEIDNIRSRLGLKPAKKPFISKIEVRSNGTDRFS